jgi:phage terminase small subunit
LAKTQGKPLNAKQQAFVTEYQKDWNAVQAAIRVGYSQKTAEAKSYQLVGDSRIVAALEKAKEQRLKKVGVHAERVLTEIARVGFSDTRKLFREDGGLKSPNEWDEDTAAAVAGLDVTDLFEGFGEDRAQVGYLKKVRTYDKVKALDILAKHLRLYPEATAKVDLNVTGSISMTSLELSARLIYLLQVALSKGEEPQALPDFGGQEE